MLWNRRAEEDLKPWVEKLIRDFGQNRREASVRAHVVGVSEVSGSVQTDDGGACMLFLSDGAVFIPAVLSAAAWEHMSELEERENFSGLENMVVSVRKFQLNFHMDQELTSCQFYLTVDQIISVGRVVGRVHPPSCTTLLSVKQQILKTWRSLIKDFSVSALNSQSAFPLSCLMGVWHNDIIMDMLNDAVEKIKTPRDRGLGVATPTDWHRERLCCRGEVSFSAPVSHLLVPEEQRELLTADCGVWSSSDTPSGLVPPQVEVVKNRPMDTQDEERLPPPVQCDRQEDAEQPILDHTRPEVWCGGGGDGGAAVNPWDMFCPAPDLLGTPSSSPETIVDPFSQESQSLLTTAAPLPMATSTQTESSNHRREPRTGSSSSSSSSSSSIVASQRPHPSPHSPAHLSVRTAPLDQTKELQDRQYVLSPPSWVTKGVALSAQDDAPKVPPTKRTQQTPPECPPTKKVHSDGSGFSYTYKPSPPVLSAFSHYRVPEQLVQWAVTYLGTPQQTLGARRTPELIEVPVLQQRSKDRCQK